MLYVLELNPASARCLTMPARGTLRTKTVEEQEEAERSVMALSGTRMRTRARTFKGGAGLISVSGIAFNAMKLA